LNNIRLIGACAAVLSTGIIAFAASVSAPGGPDPAALQVLNALEQNYGHVNSIAGSFSHTLVDTVVKTEKKAEADFKLLKPNYFRIEFKGQSVNVLQGQTFYRYEPATRNFTRTNVKQDVLSQDLGYMMLGFGAKTSEILKTYNVKSANGGKELVFTPRSAKSAYQEIVMQLTADGKFPKKFTMKQDGTQVIVDLNTGSISYPPLSPSAFQPAANFPQGLKAVDTN